MTVSYDAFTEAFLAKVTEYTFYRLPDENRQSIVDGYMRRACSKFSEVCPHGFCNGDNDLREFTVSDALTENDIEEIVDIVSDGMLEQWLRQHLYHQENLQNMLATADFSSYSPAELTYRITNAYALTKKNFTNRVREYSYRHGDLTVLHI